MLRFAEDLLGGRECCNHIFAGAAFVAFGDLQCLSAQASQLQVRVYLDGDA